MDSLGTGIEGHLGAQAGQLKVQIGIEGDGSDHEVGSWRNPNLDCFTKRRKKNIYPTKPLVDLEFNPASCVLFGTPFSGAPATAGWHLDPVLVEQDHGYFTYKPSFPSSCLPLPLPEPCREGSK